MIWVGKLNYLRSEFNTWENIQKVLLNLKKLPERIRQKIRLKDSIKILCKKKGWEEEF
jgi:hypothetical protein